MDYHLIYISVVSLWLFLCSLQDIRKKKVKVWLIAAGFIIIAVLSFSAIEDTVINRIAGGGLGIILLLLNPITRGQIGIGDGLIVGILGLCLGFTTTSFILVYGLFAAAVFSILIMLFGKVKSNKTIPFIPFLFISYLGVLLM